MRAVSNTSPLLNLAIIGHLDLLRSQFDEVLIPPGVLKELRLGGTLPSLQPALVALEETAGFRIGRDLVREILAAAGEL